ncbi:orotate phosphoribosyltransferase [Lapidilactobacillus achengensis]|uniref:Orotate phosphoribosyltransferase n=1 Tax=Lapidilactobacillus achengensis TaxID=2486000 RepID=A0ABW1UPL2_9LACO|nr:orotate phosphoribosyltransferase [Lapidilactobacillus achengensis]
MAHQIAADLLRIKAVTLSPQQPFTWASGLKSPIYTDNRLTISYPAIRQRIAQGLATMIQQLYPQVDVIAGTATAGIPHAAIVASLLDLPLIYIRSQPKDHGQGRQIEGHLAANSKAVVIDDLISTGGSVLQAVQAAQREGAQVLGVVGIFSYQLPVGQANFVGVDLPCTTLTNYTSLIETAVDQGYISAQDREILQQWRQDPQAWGAQFAN